MNRHKIPALCLIFYVLVFGKWNDGTTHDRVEYEVLSSDAGYHLIYDLAWADGETYNVRCDGVVINDSPITPEPEFGYVNFTSEHGGIFTVEPVIECDDPMPTRPRRPTIQLPQDW